MEVIVQGAVSALGYTDDGGKYCPEPDCFETLRDLIRYLRTDGNQHVARKIIGERNIVENDLIPLLKAKQDDEQMFDIVLRLMVNIVQPTLVTFMGKQPEGTEQAKLCFQLEDNLKKAKLSFADSDLFDILKKKLEKYFMQTEWDERTEEDRLVMERITVLIRYILSISHSAHDEKRTALESNSHDRVILAFLSSGIQNIFIHIASQSQEKDFHLSVLEVIGYIVKEHKPEDIIAAAVGRSDEEREKADRELQDLFEKEQSRMADTKRRMLASRHSRFAGTYWVDGVSTINKENKFFTAKPVMDINKLSFLDERKKKVRVSKNRRLCEAKEEQHLSSLELRLRMKIFLEDVLARGFNRLMKNCKAAALEGSRSLTLKNADIHYFLVMRFFLRFCRLSKMTSQTVECCVGVDSFHNLQIKIDQYLENAALQKKEGRPYGIRAQYAVTAYKELILFTQYMVEDGSAEDKEASRAVCRHILSVEEYRDLAISILKKFQPATVSKTFLQELALATHYYFRMMEKCVKSGELQSVLKRQKKKSGKKKTKRLQLTQKSSKHPCDVWPEERLDLIWAKICEDLSDGLMGHEELPEDQTAINSLLNSTDEEHQQYAMLKIQRALREKRPADAAGLYRKCRDIWYSEDIFGSKDILPEEEFVELRNIFYTDLSEIAESLVKAEQEAENRFGSSEMLDENGGSEEEDEESDYETKEVQFDFDGYVVRFAASDVIKWYLFLLDDFDKNSSELNKALVKMLHRIGFDLKMHCRLFQLSLFRILQRVAEKITPLSPEERKKSQYYELYNFGNHLLKRFFKRFKQVGERMAPEALFFKSSKESYELEHGFGSFSTTDVDKLTWSEELEDELSSLHNEWKDMDERPEGMDLFDYIEGNLSRARTRAQIQKKLKQLGLDAFGAKRTKGADKSFPIILMKELVERFNDMDDNSQLDLVSWLRESLEEKGKGTFSRPKIIKQLAYAGIPYEKKKALKTQRKKNQNENFIIGDDEDEEEGIAPLADLSDLEKNSDKDEDVPLADSDDEEGDMGTRKTTRVVLDSDDEEPMEEHSLTAVENKENVSRPYSQLNQQKDKEDSNDGEITISKKRRRVLSSDDESDRESAVSEPPSAAQSARKVRRVLIDSDDEDKL